MPAFVRPALVLLWCLSITLSARATVDLAVRLRDASSGLPTAGRLYVRDSSGFVFQDPDPANYTRWQPNGGNYVHVEDEIVVAVEPGAVELWAVRGLSGVPVIQQLNVTSNQTTTLQLDSWVDPAALGWLGADPHMHPEHDGEYPEAPLSHLGVVGRAEALDVIFLLDNDPQNPGGRVLPPQSDVEMEWGEEYRNAYWGHMIFLDLASLIETSVGPGCCGLTASAWPSLAHTLTQNSVPLAILAHPITTDDHNNAFGWPSSGYARELYPLALTSLVQGIAVLSESNAPNPSALEHYLDALRVGARWAAVGESDGAFDRNLLPPPGSTRTYAFLGGPLPQNPADFGDAWRGAVQARATFATSGPFLQNFSAEGTVIGGERLLAGPGTVDVDVALVSYEPMHRVTLHGSAGIHWEQLWPSGVTQLDLSIPITFTHDDFVLVEVECASSGWYNNPRGALLISSPIWFDMGSPWPGHESTGRRGADTLPVHWSNSLDERGYDTPEDSLAMWTELDDARAVFEALYDDPPQPFDLIFPIDGAVLPSASAFLSWRASVSLDDELVSYRVEIDDLDDAQPPSSLPPTLGTNATVQGLVAGHRYRWLVRAEEPGEPPLASQSTREFEISENAVGTVPSTHVWLGPPRVVNGRVETELDLPREVEIDLRWVDLRGRVVERQRRSLPAGRHRLEWSARGNANGVYWLIVSGAGETHSRRLVLLR